MPRSDSPDIRRWFRFSLRTLFLVMLLGVAFSLGWVSHREWLRYQQQRAAAEQQRHRQQILQLPQPGFVIGPSEELGVRGTITIEVEPGTGLRTGGPPEDIARVRALIREIEAQNRGQVD